MNLDDRSEARSRRPLGRTCATTLAVVAVLALAQCTSSTRAKASGGHASSTTRAVEPTTSGDLRSAGEVLAERAAAAAKDVTLGQTVSLAPKVTVVVTRMTLGGDDLGPWLSVSVRAENRSGDSVTNPVLAIYCKGESEGGGWQADSTYSLGDELPSGSFAQGDVNLLLPKDGRTGEAVPACVLPATVRVTDGSTVTIEGNQTSPSYDYPIARSLVTELNARRTR